MIYGIWTFCAALLAFIISAVTGKFLIPYLRKLHFGQTILEEGPKWHKGKQGTPTMGGIMFIVAIVVVTMISTVIYAFTGADLVNSFFADIPRECMFIFCGLGLAVANGFIGFIDDYIKVVKKRNLGLTASQKLILQFLVAAAFLAVLAIAGYGTTTTIPFEVMTSKEGREDVRLKYRYLDLRNEKVKNNMIFRSQVIAFLRQKMTEMGFLEIQTPILCASSPDKRTFAGDEHRRKVRAHPRGDVASFGRHGHIDVQRIAPLREFVHLHGDAALPHLSHAARNRAEQRRTSRQQDHAYFLHSRGIQII